METYFFEAFNKDNVRLVDVKSDPIERITSTGVKTGREEFDLDVLVYATGFSASELFHVKSMWTMFLIMSSHGRIRLDRLPRCRWGFLT